MLEFNIDKFIHSGSFFDKEGKKVGIDWLKENSDSVFGEEVPMYYFYLEDFTVSFVYDTFSNQITAEQIEMPRPAVLTELANYTDFVTKYDAEIVAIYGDEEETVVFMQSGVNVYFNKEEDAQLLTKITSQSDASRNLAISILDKIR